MPTCIRQRLSRVYIGCRWGEAKPASAGQVEILESIGAKYVCDSSEATFMDDLVHALAATGTGLAFDVAGGDGLPSRLLTCKEIPANETAREPAADQIGTVVVTGRDPTPDA